MLIGDGDGRLTAEGRPPDEQLVEHYPRRVDVRARVDRFADAEAFLTFFKENYGPTIAVYRFIADQPERVAELDAALIALAEEHLADGVMEWEYLLVTARRV